MPEPLPTLHSSGFFDRCDTLNTLPILKTKCVNKYLHYLERLMCSGRRGMEDASL